MNDLEEAAKTLAAARQRQREAQAALDQAESDYNTAEHVTRQARHELGRLTAELIDRYDHEETTAA